MKTEYQKLIEMIMFQQYFRDILKFAALKEFSMLCKQSLLLFSVVLINFLSML